MRYYERRHNRNRHHYRRSRKPRSPPWVLLLVLFATVFLAVHWRARLLPIVMNTPMQPSFLVSSDRRARRGTVYTHVRQTPHANILAARRVPTAFAHNRYSTSSRQQRASVRSAFAAKRHAVRVATASSRFSSQNAARQSPSRRLRHYANRDKQSSISMHIRSQHSAQKSVPTHALPIAAAQHHSLNKVYIPVTHTSTLHPSQHPVSTVAQNKTPTLVPASHTRRVVSTSAARGQFPRNASVKPNRRVCHAYLCTLWSALPESVPLPPLSPSALPWLHGSSLHTPIVPPSSAERSIFTARRKGPWMGCARRDASICTGVYRSLKRTGASSLFDVDCGHHTKWLPRVLDKLLGEYRLIRVICAVHDDIELRSARRAFGPHVNVIRFHVREKSGAEFPNADVILVRESLLKGNLISAMSVLKKVKLSKRFRYLVHDNFPRRRHNWPIGRNMRINTALPPFSFPPPMYVHAAEREGEMEGEIACRNVDDMFAMRRTPVMSDLVDPRRRVVLQ